jgi:hypothetical protein
VVTVAAVGLTALLGPLGLPALLGLLELRELPALPELQPDVSSPPIASPTMMTPPRPHARSSFRQEH